jgi:hypothetical protein
MYRVELKFNRANRLIINSMDRHYIELSSLAHEIDKDYKVVPPASDTKGENGSFIVEFETEGKADNFIQSLQKLSYIKGNPQVELGDD